MTNDRLGHNKLNSKKQTRVPDSVLEEMDVDEGDPIDYIDLEEEGAVKIQKLTLPEP